MVGKATVARLESQIEVLSVQMEDVLTLLRDPNTKPGVHEKLAQLFRRLEPEREHLLVVLREAKQRGIQSLGWGELATSVATQNRTDRYSGMR